MLGSKIMEYLKRKCNEYNFSCITSGSLKYSRGIINPFWRFDQSNLTSTSFNSKNRYRKDAFFWDIILNIVTDVKVRNRSSEEYKNNITESMLKPSPFQDT